MLVTGTTKNSRLVELKKYLITDIFTKQYVSNGSRYSDGVDYTNSISGICVTYYIGGIKFIDDYAASATTFCVQSTSSISNSPNFINVPYYKNPNMENIISNPKINDDVFIERQEMSAFENNYKLQYICSLIDLNTYAGGKYFNIINNT